MRCDLPVGHKGCYLQNTAVDGAGCGQHRAQTASRALYTAFHRQIRHLFKYMKAEKVCKYNTCTLQYKKPSNK